MYLGIDVGGTKTFVAALTDDGKIQTQERFPTPAKYQEFLNDLAKAVEKLSTNLFRAAVAGLPATKLNRKSGIGVSFGNLPWHDVPLKKDLKKILLCPVLIENDAKLAGFSEAMLLPQYSKVLYVTISTGIGTALVADKKIDENFGDAGGQAIMLDHGGKVVTWESFASGRAIVERFGKRAENIEDEKTWQLIAHDIAIGLIDVLAMTEPDVIVIGGGVGAYLPRFIKPLTRALKKYENPLLAIPPIREARQPNEAVIYGCYQLAKANYG